MRTIETAEARARAFDPPSSHDAAEQHTANGRQNAQQHEVLRAMEKWCVDGITSDELAAAAGLDRVMVARRLPELRESGYVYVKGYDTPSPERRKSKISGRSGMVWRLPIREPEQGRLL